VAGDNIYSVRTKVSLKTPEGMKNLTIKAVDKKGAKDSTKVAVIVTQREEDPIPGFEAAALVLCLAIASGGVLLAGSRYKKRRRR
jgi:hypothetical protein